VKISQLNEAQRQHLIWRIDHKTGIGLITAGCIARGEHGDQELTEVFEKAGMRPHQAKIHARKVINFPYST
jgi:hypothetical protein